MKVIVNGQVKELNIIDQKTGVNYVRDFIGNYGALVDGQFTWDEEQGAFLASEETYDWWEKVLGDHQALENRICELGEVHDPHEVAHIVNDASDVDLEDMAAAVNMALDASYGIL
ncbi:hypothetical protein J41TS12_10470 [Paenibacillus antibioticophila]|uniref:Uncharacterized protein n=1 Tax=Paenibacillus antibioticophila TaxID=1274374 RepID=A0A919XNB4_9BACL|nr:hypothetical protein [Paenibacillus antibioticophila]GIO36186.1 hypothetical protein J41TS12_10470 [Paenibacillus antibioticophila]